MNLDTAFQYISPSVKEAAVKVDLYEISHPTT